MEAPDLIIEIQSLCLLLLSLLIVEYAFVKAEIHAEQHGDNRVQNIYTYS